MLDLIQTIEILCPKEVKHLNEYIDTLEFRTNAVFDQGDNCVTRQDVRNSTGCTLNEDSYLTKNLHLKMNSALDEYKDRVSKINDIFKLYHVIVGYDTKSWREGIQILDYIENQKYDFHHDVADYRERQEFHRTISIVLYLTNDFEGGRTLFTHKEFKPLPGHALIFPSNWCFPHCGETVTSGKKRVAVTWYYVERQ